LIVQAIVVLRCFEWQRAGYFDGFEQLAFSVSALKLEADADVSGKRGLVHQHHPSEPMATAAVPPFAVLRMRWFNSRRSALRSSATDAAVTA
jgi:hypothetical protein